MLVQRLPLDRVAAEAESIVHARVVDVQPGRDESNLPATWITLDVTRALKGGRVSRVTIKQFGVTTPLADGTLAALAGLPRYAPGDEVVLFLRGESPRGFTSPVGLAQGVYRVAHEHGRAQVRDDLRRNAPQDLDEFLARVGRLVGQP